MSGWHEIRHDVTSCSYYGTEVYGRRYIPPWIQMSEVSIGTKGEKAEPIRDLEALLVQ